MTAPAVVLAESHIERLRRLARDAQQEYALLLRMVDAAIVAADRREVASLVASLDACDAKQRQVDSVVRELAVARETSRDAGPAGEAAFLAIEELLHPVTAVGAQVLASYARLRDRTTLGRIEMGRELDQLRRADTVREAYRPQAGGRTLNLVR